MTLRELITAVEKNRLTLDELMDLRDAINLAMRRTKRAGEADRRAVAVSVQCEKVIGHEKGKRESCI